MKKYKYHYSKLLVAVMAACILLCLGGMAYDVYLFFAKPPQDPYDYIKYILLFAAALLLAVVFLSLLIRTEYAVGGGQIVARFGIAKNAYSANDVKSVHLFKGSKKLFLYFENESYAVLPVELSWADDMIRAMQKENEKMTFSFSSPEEEAELKNKKKK